MIPKRCFLYFIEAVYLTLYLKSRFMTFQMRLTLSHCYFLNLRTLVLKENINPSSTNHPFETCKVPNPYLTIRANNGLNTLLRKYTRSSATYGLIIMVDSIPFSIGYFKFVTSTRGSTQYLLITSQVEILNRKETNIFLYFLFH